MTQLSKLQLSVFVPPMQRSFGLWGRVERTSFLKEHEGISETERKEELAR